MLQVCTRLKQIKLQGTQDGFTLSTAGRNARTRRDNEQTKKHRRDKSPRNASTRVPSALQDLLLLIMWYLECTRGVRQFDRVANANKKLDHSWIIQTHRTDLKPSISSHPTTTWRMPVLQEAWSTCLFTSADDTMACQAAAKNVEILGQCSEENEPPTSRAKKWT